MVDVTEREKRTDAPVRLQLAGAVLDGSGASTDVATLRGLLVGLRDLDVDAPRQRHVAATT